jgi:hypothetical protein
MVCFHIFWCSTCLIFLPQVNPKNGKPASMIADDVYEVVQKNAARLDSAIIYDRDFSYN